MDIYKIAISLSMTSNAPAVLATLSNALTHAHVKATQLQGSLNRVQLAVGGAMAAFAGTAALKALGGLVDKGNELVRVMRNMEQAGATALQVKHADDEAKRLTAIHRNISRVEIMKAINDARGIFGNQDMATHEIGPIVRSASFLKAFMGDEKGGGAHSGLMREMNAALKSGELAGKIAPADMAKHIDMLTAMKVAFGEQLKIGQYLTAQRAAGVSLRNVDDRFRYGMFPALVQENGVNAGTMLMTAFNKVVAGVGNRTDSIQFMMQKGILDPKLVKFDKVGRAIGLKDPEAIKDNRAAAMNFASWVMTTLAPKLPTDPIRQSQEISKLFPDRNAAKAVTEIVQQWSKLNKDADLVFQAHGKLIGKGAEGYAAGSWDYQKQAFHTQLDNVIQAAGSALLPKATENLAKLNDVLTKFSTWSAKPEHATALTAIAEGVAVLGLALVGGGGAAIIAAMGPAGWIAAGIVGLAGAIYKFRESGFGQTLSDKLNAFSADFEAWKMRFYAVIADGIPKALTAFDAVATTVGASIGRGLDALGAAMERLWEKIKGIFTNMLPSGKAPDGSYDALGNFIPGAYHGGGFGGASVQKVSLGGHSAAAVARAVNDNSPFIAGSTGGLKLKSAEAVAGGASHAGLTAFAADLQKGGGVGHFSALNDAYHHRLPYRSLHTMGRALDASGNIGQMAANARSLMAAAGLVEDRDYRILTHPHGTGRHFHFQFQSPAAAEAYERAMRRPNSAPAVGPPPRPAKEEQHVHNIHIGGEKVATVMTRHIGRAANYPSRIGGSDSYGSWRPPGVTVTDAA